MEYTKDIILNVNYKKCVGFNRLKEWTSSFKKAIKNNKLVVITLTLLITLITIDIALVNSFLQLLSRMY